jgi:predicted permease
VKRRREQRLDKELRFHFDCQVADNIRAGMREDEARREARLKFGGMEGVKDDCRDARRWAWAESTAQDIRFAARLLRKSPAFTIAAIGTLALCIGANTAIFTVLNAVVLDPLPYPDSSRLVTLYNIYPGAGLGTDRGANSVPDYLDRTQLTDVFQSVALIGEGGYDVGAEGSPVRVNGQYVTPSYFHTLGVAPELGRAFTEEDATLGKEKFAILSHGLWKEMLGGDGAVVGKTIRLSGVPYQIVGVMPEGFRSPGSEARLWVPFAFTPQQMSDDARHNNGPVMMARLQPGVTLEYARQRLAVVDKRNIERLPKLRKLLEDAKFQTKIVWMRDELVKNVRPTLYLLQAVVALVLLIGCGNVASLMLVRVNVRMKELAIRFSLGAGRIRVARQLLTESLILAALGGALGVLTGYAGLRALLLLGAKELPRGGDIRLSGGALAFSAGIALLTGLVFGLVPVFYLFRRDLNEIFRGNERTGTSALGALWTRGALVVCQVSLAFVLLIGAGLLTLSFTRLLNVDPGFKPQHVLSAQLSLPRSRYKDDARVRNFLEAQLEALRRLPGVANAGANTALPFTGSNQDAIVMVEGHTLAPGELPPAPFWNFADAGYFQTMGIPLLEGRAIAESDTADAPRVAVIDQNMARKYWSRSEALGARIRMGAGETNPPWTIVGIVGSVKRRDLAEQHSQGEIYFPYKQQTPRSVRIVVKTTTDDLRLIETIRRQIQSADPEMPVFDVKTMPSRLATSMVNRRAAMVLCVVFAGLALLLSAIGIYGVLAYTVTHRTREFGIRVALGAGVRDVVGMVVGHGAKLAAAGLAIGVAGAAALTRLMASFLYDVKPGDPTVFVGVAAGLMAVALGASLIPSLRAARIRPAIALRHE